MILDLKRLARSLGGFLGRPVAGPETDPARFFSTLYALPNPDPILREMGRAEQVYYSIAADAHVLGDIRSIRGNFRSWKFRLKEGDAGDAKSAAALELAQDWLQRTQPNHLADWLEVMWQMGSAFLYGYVPHELVWELQGGNYLPGQVLDRPGRRFKFDAWGQPLLVSVNAPLGKPVEEPYLFVISRHMPTVVNPYGVAGLSSCFWPWSFKNGGWRYFVKYCERHGLPWPIGRYPIGTQDEDIDKLEAALAKMMEAGYVVTQEGTGLELLVPSGSGAGALPQQNLIDLCNREMSKALTSQAMVAELQGTGARAASEVADKRQASVDDSVRDIAVQTMGTVLRWITLFNFGDGVAPPVLEFYKPEKASKDRAETYQKARDLGANPSKKAMLEELGIPEAQDEADRLAPMPAAPAPPPAPGALPTRGQPAQVRTQPASPEGDAGQRLLMSGFSGPGFRFARAAGMTEDEAVQLATEAADRAIEDRMIAPVADMLARYEAEGRTLAEFRADLEGMVGALDDAGLREVLERALSYSILRGAATQAD